MCMITEIARDTLLSSGKHEQTIQLHASSFKYQERHHGMASIIMCMHKVVMTVNLV